MTELKARVSGLKTFCTARYLRKSASRGFGWLSILKDVYSKQCRLLAHRVSLLRRTDSVAIEGIADIGEALLPVGATRMTRFGHGRRQLCPCRQLLGRCNIPRCRAKSLNQEVEKNAHLRQAMTSC
jgi:hypothetical protein